MSDGAKICPEEMRGDSPYGEIQDEELLVRTLRPHMFDAKSGELLREALPTDHFREKDGWSVIRKSFADINDAVAKHACHSGEKLSDCGYATVKAANVRNMRDGQNPIRVIDDPKKDCPAHALLQKTPSEKTLSRLVAQSIRNELLKLFKLHYSVPPTPGNGVSRRP